MTQIDCEGCEWPVIERLALRHPTLLAQVDQIAMELHAFGSTTASLNGEVGTHNTSKLPPSFSVPRLRAFVHHIFEDHGFAVASRHLNLASLLKDHRFDRSLAAALAPATLPMGSHLWSYWELLMVRPPRRSQL